VTKDQLAKKYLIQNYLFKIAGIMLAIVGFIVFIPFYQTYINGNVMNFIHRPYLVAIMIIPFLPAIILLIMSKKARKNAANILLKEQDMNKSGKQA